MMVSSAPVVIHVVDQARREKAEQIACCVMSDRIPESESLGLVSIGCMRDGPSGDLQTPITGNCRKRSETQSQEMKVVREDGVAYRSVLVEGGFPEKAQDWFGRRKSILSCSTRRSGHIFSVFLLPFDGKPLPASDMSRRGC